MSRSSRLAAILDGTTLVLAAALSIWEFFYFGQLLDLATARIFLLAGQVGWGLVSAYIVVRLLVSGEMGDFLRRVGLPLWPLWLFVLLVLLSQLWSISPFYTSRAALGLAVTTLAGVYLGYRYQPHAFTAILGGCLAVLALASLVMVAFFPQYGVMEGLHAGAWRGVLVHKNIFGWLMAGANMVFLARLAAWRDHPWRVRLWDAFFYAVSLLFAFRSQSATSYLVVAGMHALLLLYALLLRFGPRLKPAHWLAAAAAGLAALVLSGLNIEFLLALIGKKPHLTGRMPLWTTLFTEFIPDTPAWGYGFGAFWREFRPAVNVFVDWNPDHAHNGFIDNYLSLGWPGTILLLALLGLAVTLALAWARSRRSASDAFPLLAVAYVLVVNLPYSLLGANKQNFPWLLLAYALAAVAAWLKPAPARRDP